MQNIFENPAFSMSALTAAINILPNKDRKSTRLNSSHW